MKKMFAIVIVLSMTMFALTGCNIALSGDQTHQQNNVMRPSSGTMQSQQQDNATHSPSANAQSHILYEDMCGDCRTWVDDTYTLYIAPNEGSTTSRMGDDYWWNNDKGELSSKIKNVVIEEGVVAPVDASYMFAGLSNVECIDASGLDTSKTTDMKHMFRTCANLENIDLESWDTSNVRDMSFMFYGCKALDDLHMEGWDFSKVQTTVVKADGVKIELVDNMFDECTNLQTVCLPSGDAAKKIESSVYYSTQSEVEFVDIDKDIDVDGEERVSYEDK